MYHPKPNPNPNPYPNSNPNPNPSPNPNPHPHPDQVCTTNQSSVPKAWQEFDDDGRMKRSNPNRTPTPNPNPNPNPKLRRMKPSSLRERVVDVMEA